MLHDRVDLATWTAHLPLARLRAEARRRVTEISLREYGRLPDDDWVQLTQPDVQQVVGPYDLAVLEQLRADLRDSLTFAEPLPVDVFVYARGEAPRRDLTKTAGLPYWPKSTPWPVTPAGESMTFLLQLCFADSNDLTGALPGDLLVIFVDAERLNAGEWDDPAVWHFSWQPLGLADLVTLADVPPSVGPWAPFYAARYRTVDYREDAAYYFDNDHASHLFSVEGTKIGGRPSWVQGAEKKVAALRFLASVGSNNPNPYAPWPYLNVEPPLNSHQKDTLLWGDMGSLYLFLTDQGGLRWTVQGY